MAKYMLYWLSQRYGYQIFLSIWIICIWILLKLLPYKAWRTILRHGFCIPWSHKHPDDLLYLIKTNVILSHLRCLPAAVASHHFLTCHGVASQFHFGVRRSQGQYSFHAWVTVKGEVMVGNMENLNHFHQLVTSYQQKEINW